MISIKSVLGLKMVLKIVLFLIVTCVTVKCEKKRYDFYSLYKVYPQNEAQTQLLQEMHDKDKKFHFWNEPKTQVSKYVTVLSNLDNRVIFEDILKENNIKFDITLSNIQK